MCKVVMCAVHNVSLNISANLFQGQTLLNYNIWICIPSRYCQIWLKYVAVISTSPV
jgi:hypothetical protein